MRPIYCKGNYYKSGLEFIPSSVVGSNVYIFLRHWKLLRERALWESTSRAHPTGAAAPPKPPKNLNLKTQIL
jgi:hypothetical protein